MGQLSSALAHEINQPLGAILRNAEAAALFMQQPSPDLHEVSAIIEDIRKDDQRASAVIDRIRTLLRHEQVEMTSLDIGEVLGDVGTLLRPDAAARHVALHLDVRPGLPPVHGDRVQIQQVLLNLILNAMDALEGAGGRSRSVTITARNDTAASVEISVADTGRGIAADQFARIFEPFFTTKSKGIGMGLSISRSIIESHGGRLWAENNAGPGAKFRFTLPIAREPPTRAVTRRYWPADEVRPSSLPPSFQPCAARASSSVRSRPFSKPAPRRRRRGEFPRPVRCRRLGLRLLARLRRTFRGRFRDGRRATSGGGELSALFAAAVSAFLCSRDTEQTPAPQPIARSTSPPWRSSP
jgi:hypothetical protein